MAAALAVVSIFSATTGCELYGPNRRVLIEAPVLPPAWATAFGSIDYELTWFDVDGAENRALLSCADAETRGPGGESDGAPALIVELPKLPVVPVVAAPIVAGHSGLLRPAGAVFPRGLRADGAISLTWHEGFIAQTLLALAGSGFDISIINVPRLSDAIWNRSGHDPWLLDRDRILRSIQTQTFRSDAIRPTVSYPVSLRVLPATPSSPLDAAKTTDPAPAATTTFRLISDDPFAPALSFADGGTLPPTLDETDQDVGDNGVQVSLTEGLHRYFTSDGRFRIDVMVDSDGRGETMVMPGPVNPTNPPDSAAADSAFARKE